MKSRHRLALGLGVVLLTVFGSMSEAAAQYGPPRPYYAPPPPPRGVYRGGLLFGLGGGFGLLESDFCGQAAEKRRVVASDLQEALAHPHARHRHVERVHLTVPAHRAQELANHAP